MSLLGDIAKKSIQFTNPALYGALSSINQIGQRKVTDIGPNQKAQGPYALPDQMTNRSSTAGSVIAPTLRISNKSTAPDSFFSSGTPTPKGTYVDSIVGNQPNSASTNNNTSLYALPEEDYDSYEARIGGNSNSSVPNGNKNSVNKNTQSSAPTDEYSNASADYIASLGSNDRVNAARKRYMDFVASRDAGLQGIQDQVIPMQDIIGQQQSLNNQAEIQGTRLQGDVSLAEDAQKNNQAQALARYNIANDQKSAADKLNEPINVGGVLYQRQDDGSYKAVTPTASEDGFTLGKDQIRYDAAGNIIAGTPNSQNTNSQNSDALQQQSKTAQSTIDVIDELLARGDDKIDAITGIPAISSFFPGTDAQVTKNLAQQLGGMLSLQNRQQLKGSGAISDFEFKVLQQAASSLGIDSSGRSNLSAKEFTDELKKLKSNLTDSVNAASGGIAPDEENYLLSQGFSKSDIDSLRQTSFNSGDGNIPQKNNNPGNLKRGGIADTLAVGQDKYGHLIFPDPDTGRRALIADIDSKISGNSKYLPANPTIAQIGSVYAEDKNWPKKVADLVGATPNTLASSINRNKLINAIMTQEGYFA